MIDETKKLAVVTLGCKVNQYDTDSVVTQFLDAGYTIVGFKEVADVYLINTCTVTNLGDRKSRQAIRRAHKNNPDAKVVVMGCLAQTTPDAVATLEGVTLVVGTNGRGSIVEEIEGLESGEQRSLVEDIFDVSAFEDMPSIDFSGRTRATLKIQDGCNQFCTYCRVPFARGPSRSRRPASVLEQVEQTIALGYKEIVLTGIHLGLYGADLDPPLSLARISAKVARTPGLSRLRIGSVDPHEITDELIGLVATDPVLCRHMHIPLQSGSDAVLGRMKRNYTGGQFREIVSALRDRVPQIAITTDIMVGFPGETEEDFLQTMDLARDVAFSKIHVFQYSKRAGTRAARFPDQIASAQKEDRSRRLIQLGEAMAERFHRSFIGKNVEVLVEQMQKGQAIGHTDNYVKVTFPELPDEDLVGDVVFVRILSASVDGVQGHVMR
ncbi:MAG: tRNA (N(6)-L-threonylcarbamoyladenosine(37)-C(2))-methylthiotransferase MtaB [Limnochordia bacterium]|jgi:threonylcarbamoyladenosine tRNA methylthiotransferase MtaB|nr:tRNA (N(6)-L-threonylcarbamoyladenosine(37)-C(2))-methylthiotransferase MtaB [Limnochordia bacterium]